MPLGILTPEELEQEISNSSKSNGSNGTKDNGILIPEIEQLPPAGRNHKKETPESIRKTVAEEAINGASAKELAKTFNLSESSVSAYKKGATSTATYNEPNKELKEHINDYKTDLATRARKRLTQALTEITPERMATAKLRDVSSVARDMSVIIKNLDTDESDKDKPAVQFVLYAPQMKRVDDYEVIDIKEQEDA